MLDHDWMHIHKNSRVTETRRGTLPHFFWGGSLAGCVGVVVDKTFLNYIIIYFKYDSFTSLYVLQV